MCKLLRLDRRVVDRREIVCPGKYNGPSVRWVPRRPVLQQGEYIRVCVCLIMTDEGQKCQKEAWARVHKYECKNPRPVVNKDIPKAVRACMEILIRRKHGLILDPAWEMLCRLDTHVEDFQRNGSYSEIQLMAMAANAFSFTQDSYSIEAVAAMYARVSQSTL